MASTRAITPTHTSPFSASNRASTPNTHSAPSFGVHITKSPRGLSPRVSPQPLTGAAAIEDDRRRKQGLSRQTSPNPAITVMQSLSGTDQSTMSKPTDAPAHSTQMNSSIEKAAKALVIPEQTGMTGDNMQTSPVSMSSSPPPTSAALPMNTQDLANEPSQRQQQLPPPSQHQTIAPNLAESPGNRAFTFPGPMPPEHDPRAPARQMSLPGYAQNSPKSPSTKRHKCPYCSTDFTRHHNLKSHLLTHSQEKPYECPTCQARFRRLHDLKRHTKLHTGERPHTCPKCGRRFARGDALARHNKGQGGCAGRRSSFGIDNDDMDGKGDDTMDGIVYQGEHDGEGDEDDNDGRRVSEPARKRQNTGNSTPGSYHQHSSTYPPIAANRGQLSQHNFRAPYPPGSQGTSHDHSTDMSPKLAPSNMSSLHYTATAATMFGQSGMTESPKPLSPGLHDQHRHGTHENSNSGPRSPNVHPSLRGNGPRVASPIGMVPPQTNGPHLPTLPGLNPGIMSKQGSQGGSKNGPSMLQHQQMPGSGSGSQPGSVSSHGASSGGSMREVMGGQVDVWQYVRDVEARMAKMEKEHETKMGALQTEVTTLRAQLAQQHARNIQQ